MVFQCGLKPAATCTGSRASQAVQAKVSHCVLLGATGLELQSDLQMTAIFSGLGGAQERPSCKPRLATASAWPGAT